MIPIPIQSPIVGYILLKRFLAEICAQLWYPLLGYKSAKSQAPKLFYMQGKGVKGFFNGQSRTFDACAAAKLKSPALIYESARVDVDRDRNQRGIMQIAWPLQLCNLCRSVRSTHVWQFRSANNTHASWIMSPTQTRNSLGCPDIRRRSGRAVGSYRRRRRLTSWLAGFA